MDARHCSHCGTPAGPAERLCRACGAALAAVRGAPPALEPAPQAAAPAAPAPTATSGSPAQPAPQSGISTWPAPGHVPSYPYPSAYPYPDPTPYGYAPPGAAPAQFDAPYGMPPWPGYAPYYGYAPAGYAPSATGYPPPGYPYAGYPYPYPQPALAPRRAPGETYALVISWIVLVLGVLSIIGGGLVLAVGVFTAASTGTGLDGINTFAGLVVPAMVGGIVAIVYAAGRLRRHASAAFALPSAWHFVVLTAIALGVGVALWNAYPAPGAALAVAPLSILCGVLPALAILALGAQRLHQPSSRRHVWLSLIYGATIAPLLAGLLELVLAFIFVLLLRSLGYPVSFAVTSVTHAPANSAEAVALLVIIAVMAPLIEEGLKPLGVVLIMRRVSTPAEAFLLGLAAGIGFDMVETVSYIGLGEADWVSVAIQRVGTGLLHGVGAGIAALGWYYLINGRGVRWRWLRGLGGLVYAVAQHALFNASNLLPNLPGTLGHLISAPVSIGTLPLDSGIVLFFALYVVILAVLVLVTGRLARGVPMRGHAEGGAAVPGGAYRR